MTIFIHVTKLITFPPKQNMQEKGKSAIEIMSNLKIWGEINKALLQDSGKH